MAKYDTSRYDELYNEYAKHSEASVAKQKQQADADFNSRLKQAYISRMQDEKSLTDNMSKLGIRGGASESTLLKNNINYQNTRNALGSERAKTMQQIDDTASQNLLEYKQANDSAKLSYVEQREAEDRQLAQAQKEQKTQSNIDFWTAKYSRYYSDSDLIKAYKNAKTQEEKTVILARRGYLKSHKKGY